MLQNAYFLAKIGADTAENAQHFAENLPKIGNYPTRTLKPPSPREPRPAAPCHVDVIEPTTTEPDLSLIHI